MVKTAGFAGVLTLSCARLAAGRVTSLCCLLYTSDAADE